MEKEKLIGSTLVAIIFLLAFSFVLPKNNERVLAEMFWTKKVHAKSVYDVVIMGDSRVYRGVNPKIIEEEAPELKVLNFGFSDGGLNPTMFKSAEEKLNNNNRPKFIVLGVSANTLTGYTENNKQYLQELFLPREEILERLYFNPVLYWFSSVSIEQLKNHYFKNDLEDDSYYINRYCKSGYVESEKFPIDTMSALPYYVSDYKSYKVEQFRMDQLFAQIKEWTEEGIHILAFRPPTTHPMEQLENAEGLYDEDYISKEIENAGGEWIDLNINDFQTYDGSHLTVESAKALSYRLGQEIESIIKEN